MKNEDEASNSLLTEENNSLFLIWRELKNSIFNVLFVLLNQSDDGEEESIFGLTFEVGLDYLQMMAFPFNSAIISVWNGGPTLTAFFQTFSNLSFGNYIPGVSFGTFLIMLYLLIFLIILVILDIIYVSYSFSKKKFAFTWPLEFLAKVVPLCVTVFFLPIMETLLSVVSCQNSNNDPNIQVMQNFPNVVCWQGWHMFHAVVTLFFTSIFVFISSIVALTIFEPRMTTNRLTARQNSSGEVIFIVNKMICQFVFSFTPFNSTEIYCVMLFVLSGWLWMAYNIEQPLPFYNKNASKFFRICSTYYFWTNTMLMVSQLLISYGFEGGLVVWMCGLPFIGISIVFERKSNIDKLFSSNLKFRSGEELESHLQYVLQLIHNRSKDKNSYMLLLGYIEKHIEICLEEDCPLRLKNLKKEQNLEEIEENCQQLIKQLLKMYKEGIKKYPKCTRLRLSFAFFYMEQLSNNNRAYEEFTIAQTTEPTFGEQFIIYRFKKIIRENLEEEKEDDENDLIEIIRFDNHVSLCEEAMMLSARLHKDFWAELEEETPDLIKLNEIGSQITQATMAVKENYKEVEKINSHVSEVIHNYAIYLIFVGQSQFEGKELLEHAKRIYFEKKESLESDNMVLMLENKQYSDLSMVEKSFSSVVKISFEDEGLGKIIYVNEAFTELTGYLKEDAIGRSVDKLLPEIYGPYHNNAVRLWMTNQEKKILSINNEYILKPHNGFIHHKSGFILSIDYRVSFNIEENTFLTVLRPSQEENVEINSKIYLITNTQNIIKDVSHLGLVVFGINRESCENNEITVEDLGVPKDIDHEKLLSRAGVDIKINHEKPLINPTYASTFPEKISHQQLEFRDDEKNQEQESFHERYYSEYEPYTHPSNSIEPSNFEFNIRAEEIWMPVHKEYEETIQAESLYINGKLKIGYVYVLEKITIEPHINPKQSKNTELNIFDDFVDQFYQEDPKYLFEEVDSLTERHRLKKSKILAEMLIEMNNGEKITFESKQFRNYAEELKIKTYRYFNEDYHRIYEVEYEQDSLLNAEEGNDEFTANDIKNHVSRMENRHYQLKIKEAINTEIEHKEVLCLRGLSVTYLMVLCGLCAGAFATTLGEFDKITSSVADSYLHMQDLEFITGGIQSTINYKTGTMNSSEVSSLISEMREYQLVFDPDDFIYCELEEGRVQYMSLLEVMNLIQSQIITYFDPESLTKDITIAYRNFLISVYPVIEAHSTQSTVTVELLLVLTVLTLIFSIIMIMIWIYFIMKLDEKQFDIMIWFLDIPIDYVVYLQNNCVRFIKNYTTIKELEVKGISMDDKEHYCDEYEQKIGNEDEEIDEDNMTRKIMIAKHKKKTFISKFHYGYLSTLWLIIYSSIIPLLYIGEVSYEKLIFELIIDEWQLISQEYLWSSTFPIVLNLEQMGYNQFNNSIGSMNLLEFEYELRGNFLNTLTKHNKANQINLLIDQANSLSGIYANAYYGDLCSLIGENLYQFSSDEDPSQDDSNEDINDESNEDLNEDLYDQFISQCTSLLDHKLHAGLTTYFSYLTNINASLIDELTQSQSNITGPSMLLILSTWRDYFISEIESFESISNIIIYIYLTITILSFLSLWLIYLNKQNDKMNRTIQMLNMIPIDMLPKNRKDTREFIEWLITMANKQKEHEDN